MRISSVILVDVGNTSTQVAVEQGDDLALVRRIASKGQTGRNVRAFLKAYGRLGKIDGAIICSVVPQLDKIWINELKKIVSGKVLRFSRKLNLGMKLNYPDPAALGADRLANAVAAREKYGAPVVAADFGTGLTFDFVGAAGAYEGGIIAPGPMMFAQCLAERTALLPRLTEGKIRKIFQKKQVKLIGKNTEDAMLIGIRLGYLGMLKEVLAQIRRDPRAKRAKLCATGGYAGLVLKAAGLKISIDPFLTLRGISRIYRLNS